jgi:hypothetical protein
MLGVEYTTYLTIMKPHLSDRALITICKKCITKTELDLLRTTPYEQLGLLFNHPWYGVGTDRLYKDRLSGLIP